jgi:phosphate transport system substrate-binding protein
LKRTRLLGLILAALIAAMSTGLTAGASAATTNGTITGAGSTLVKPLLAAWATDFESKASIGVTYGAVGSGAGIAQITARTVDFGASDAPLTAAQAASCNGCVQIPWALSATGIAIHINGLRKLNLSVPVLAGIYLGKITTWNDPLIAALNKGASLPATKITPVFRSDASGDTYAFTDLLTRVSATWAKLVGNSTSVSFPVGVGAKGNDGVAAVVGNTDGAISYIAASYIIAHGLNAAALENNAKKFVYPNLANIAAAAKVVKKVPANNEMHIVNPPKSAKSAYPLSTFTYVIVPKGSPKKSLLTQFINYALTTGQSFGATLDFPVIPKVVLKAAQKSLATL